MNTDSRIKRHHPECRVEKDYKEIGGEGIVTLCHKACPVLMAGKERSKDVPEVHIHK